VLLHLLDSFKHVGFWIDEIIRVRLPLLVSTCLSLGITLTAGGKLDELLQLLKLCGGCRVLHPKALDLGRRSLTGLTFGVKCAMGYKTAFFIASLRLLLRGRSPGGDIIRPEAVASRSA
jgi:hypothetical protein